MIHNLENFERYWRFIALVLKRFEIVFVCLCGILGIYMFNACPIRNGLVLSFFALLFLVCAIFTMFFCKIALCMWLVKRLPAWSSNIR